MTLIRLQKRLARRLVVSWREQPTRYDIEALQANIRRVGLVVRVRWMLITMLALYSVLAGLLYLSHMKLEQLVGLMTLPALALGFVVLYNTYYSLNYRRLGNIAVWNNLQLGLDALVVTVLVYYSGGVNSWFWSMYALFIFEAAAILPRSRDVWAHALFSCLLLGIVEWAEFVGWLEHIVIPFSSSVFHHDLVFVSVRYTWQVAVLLGMAAVSTLIVGQLRQDLSARIAQRVLDDMTGLYSRSYFGRALGAQLRRAARSGRQLYVLLIDIDSFGEFNTRFGVDAGDRMLASLARVFRDGVAPTGDMADTDNLAARYGGEEFALLVTETDANGTEFTREEALAFAQSVRQAASEVHIDGAGVTVSVGLASFPEDGLSAEELLDAADAALVCAVEAGGDRVVTTADCAGSIAGSDVLA